ncbi:hypothetical protein IFM89_031325 [Coptis chinensis]|uniref:Defective in cullin neddylation protein n=1 Tax=Coptis chinensis TaxID=261450 RepID=A0A835MB66_9MAGN|nr:hypothetical protein IFM89_031325 [Coptis chinensis]
MDSSDNNTSIFEIYSRYCGIRSVKHDAKEELAQLLKLLELRRKASSIVDDLNTLMPYLDLTVDSCRFARFYDFVFFMCRKNGQKNITVTKAIDAWKLVLKGRFRLLNEWCGFVEKHQRHNIPEDTWQQLLAFSRCVHEDLEGYDPKGAWPVLIDEFVDHMYRITSSNSSSTRIRGCNCGDSEAEPCRSDDSFPGLKVKAGWKRKAEVEFSNSKLFENGKRSRSIELDDNRMYREANRRGSTTDDQMENASHGSQLGSLRHSACAIEGSLSDDLAKMQTTSSY